MNKLVGKFGVAGYSLGNYNSAAGIDVTNGATYVMMDTNWFCRYQSLPPGGAVWWFNVYQPGGNFCDRAGIFHIAQPEGGEWNLQISTNGGPWVTVLTVNGFSATPTGHLAYVTLPLNRYRVRAEGVRGTNITLGPYTLNSQTTGIHVVFTDSPWLWLDLVTNVPLAVREPIFAALQPDLIVWHMKEDVELATSNRMVECERWWSKAVPNSDVLYLGTPWVSEDTNATPGSYKTADQNLIVRNIALDHHRAYVDLMQPTISYDWLRTNGYMADGTHLNSAGGLLCANIMWDDLGFFALGLNRQLSLLPFGSQMQLSYHTDARAAYRLETSTNQLNWLAVVTNPPGSTLFSTNFNPTSAGAFYRLGLSPK